MTALPWPHVLTEWETLRAVAAGQSLARFGDGELKLLHGAGQVREPAQPALAEELRLVLQSVDARCLAAVPTMDPRGAKYHNWQRHHARFLGCLDMARTYGSAFVSRPDSAPWIRTPAYAQALVALWEGKRVALVSEPGVAIYRAVALTAPEGWVHISCPHQETYRQLDHIEAAVHAAQPAMALLSCGPAATCLAYRLAIRGIQALDIGSAGGFLLKELFGLVTQELK